MKAIWIILLVVGGLPLAVYPFVLLANVMSLAGHRTGNEPVLQTLASFAFLIASTLYPLVYVPCLIFTIINLRSQGNATLAMWFSLGPIIYLAFVIVLMMIWMRVS